MHNGTGETLCETRGDVRGNEGKHVGNCRLRGFLTHLVTSFQPTSYTDGTTHEYEKMSIVFPARFSL